MKDFFDAADAALVESKLTSELVYDGKIVHLYRDDVRLPDGNTALREVIRHVGAVCVVPLTEAGEVICVRQYRYAAGQVMLEIPAGKLDDKQEDRREAALRELREETGVRCETLTSLGAFYPAPAYSDELIDMYLAEGLSYGDTDPDEDEFLDVVRVPLAEMVDMAMRGELPDAKTQMAVLRVWAIKQREGKEKC
jgi:ADP-ribose pyrophosphatase